MAEPMRCQTVGCGKVRRVEAGETCEICAGGVYRFLTAQEQRAWDFSMARHTEAPSLVRESFAELHTESIVLV